MIEVYGWIDSSCLSKDCGKLGDLMECHEILEAYGGQLKILSSRLYICFGWSMVPVTVHGSFKRLVKLAAWHFRSVEFMRSFAQILYNANVLYVDVNR